MSDRGGTRKKVSGQGTNGKWNKAQGHENIKEYIYKGNIPYVH